MRYALERRLWISQQLERRTSTKYPREKLFYQRAAESAFREVLINMPTEEAMGTWRISTTKDIRRVRLLAQLGLIRLCFLEYRTGAFVSHFKSDIFDPHATSLGSLAKVRSIYSTTVVDTLKCRSLLADIIDSSSLLLNYVELGDPILSFPIYVAQVSRDSRDESRYVEIIGRGDSFYTQITDAWPDSTVGHRAKYYRSQLRLFDSRLIEAERDVLSLLASESKAIPFSELLLLQGRILHAQTRFADADSIYAFLLSDQPTHGDGLLAGVNGAEIEIRRGNLDEALTTLHKLETDKNMPEEVTARAAILRAFALRKQGRWEESFELLNWTSRLHPYTLAAVQAPLGALRDDIAVGDSTRIMKTFELARRYYTDVIRRDSSFLEYRHMVKDFLIESYLLVGREEEIASLLEEVGQELTGDNGAVTLLKSGLIYMNLLDNPGKSAAVFKKSIELFPQTGYGMLTRRQLDRIAKPQREDS